MLKNKFIIFKFKGYFKGFFLIKEKILVEHALHGALP